MPDSLVHATAKAAEVQGPGKPPVFAAIDAAMNEAELRQVLIQHFGEPDPLQLMASILDFLSRYLVCDEHQFTILALWIVHTWTFRNASTAAYLNIRSPETESGKTRCLQLLDRVCDSPWFASGPTAATVITRLLKNRSTHRVEKPDGSLSLPLKEPVAFLLDDCHHIFAPSERQPLIAMLNSGCRRQSRYSRGETDYNLFGPKAFASNCPLPRSLASRCIPIMLRRKKPSQVVGTFISAHNDFVAEQITVWLHLMSQKPEWLTQKIYGDPLILPEGWALTAHEQDCAEPLLHIADAIGGPWPEWARAAIAACFRLADCSPSVQILADVRASFLINDNPEHLLTRDLLPMLRSMDHRPWAAWPRTAGSARRLAHLLEPFGISPRKLTSGDNKGLMSYSLTDFEDAWERYLQVFSISGTLADATSSSRAIVAEQTSGNEASAATGSGA